MKKFIIEEVIIRDRNTGEKINILPQDFATFDENGYLTKQSPASKGIQQLMSVYCTDHNDITMEDVLNSIKSEIRAMDAIRPLNKSKPYDFLRRR